MNWKGLFNGFWFVRVVLVLWLVSACFVVFLLGRIDGVVHGTLYDFGLQFSLDWAVPYWSFLRLVYVVLCVPMVLSGVVLVFSVFGRGEREVRVVRREVESVRKVEVGQGLRGNNVVVSCPKCRRVFGKPLVMLDFGGGGKARLVNVCPYCNHVLGSADEHVDVKVGVLKGEKEEEEVEED